MEISAYVRFPYLSVGNGYGDKVVWSLALFLLFLLVTILLAVHSAPHVSSFSLPLFLRCLWRGNLCRDTYEEILH